jgi:prepilin signal peptidase PulO-like enzyme (type II secretory pathway)
MIFCLPALLILMAAGVARVGQKWQPAVALGIMLVLSARMIPFVYSHDFEDERDGAGVATDFILDHAHPGDGVIFHIPQIRIPYEFFRSLRASGGGHGDTLGPEILYPRHGANLNYLDFKSKLSADQLRSAVAGHARVWVVLMYNGPKLPDPTAVLLKQQLPESYARVERWEFTRVELLLYSK